MRFPLPVQSKPVLRIFIFSLLCTVVSSPRGYGFSADMRASAGNVMLAEAPSDAEPDDETTESDKPKKYRWLFKERSDQETQQSVESTTALQKLDREIKEARRLYLSGQTENSILKYRSVLDNLESVLEDIPPGSALLKEVQDRLTVFDELATKMLGPVQVDPPEQLSGRVFHLLEKRRIVRRNLVLKKAGVIKFFDVSSKLLAEEAEILKKLLQLKAEPHSAASRRTAEALTAKLADVRKSLQKSSPRYALLRKGSAVPLAEFQKDLIGKDEIILDFNFLADRMVVGMITSEKATYHQVPANRAEIDKGVFKLQDKLREFIAGGGSSFMGHAWKEPARRIFRAVMGKLPPVPADKPKVFVIPDRSLWYLPFSVMLDAEDQPFGRGRSVSLISSMDMLRFARSSDEKAVSDGARGDLLLFEAIPWISEEEVRKVTSRDSSRKKAGKRIPEEQQTENLIVANPVYPKPSEIVVSIQKFFKKFDVWIGQTATAGKLMEYKGKQEQVTVMAVPLSMTDEVAVDRHPALFFAPDAKGNRRLDCRSLFQMPLGTKVLVLPISWFDVRDVESPSAEGPLLLSTAMCYAGVRMCLINYSDPNWGSDEPFLLRLLKNVAAGGAPSESFSTFPYDLPAGLDITLSGKPPSWTGWIVMGDPS